MENRLYGRMEGRLEDQGIRQKRKKKRELRRKKTTHQLRREGKVSERRRITPRKGEEKKR